MNNLRTALVLVTSILCGTVSVIALWQVHQQTKTPLIALPACRYTPSFYTIALPLTPQLDQLQLQRLLAPDALDLHYEYCQRGGKPMVFVSRFASLKQVATALQSLRLHIRGIDSNAEIMP